MRLSGRYLFGCAGSRPIGLARILVGVAAGLGALEVGLRVQSLSDSRLARVPRSVAFPDLPSWATTPFLVLWVAAAAAFGLGLMTRPAGIVLLALLAYVLGLDQQLYSNHLYLLALLILLLTWARSDASLSLRARSDGPQDQIPAWPVFLLRAQISIVYGFAVLTKLNVGYLSGAVLFQSTPIPGIENLPGRFFVLAAAASVLVEAFLVWGFWFRRTRGVALVVGLGFHFTILVAMRILPDLLSFGLLMAAGYAAFFSEITEQPAESRPKA